MSKEKSVIKKVRGLKRKGKLIIIALVLSTLMLFIMAAGLVVSAGGFLVLFRPESLKADWTTFGSSSTTSTRPGGSTGMPELLPGERFYMPVPKFRISSQFGGRESPGGIGSTNHKGMDISNGRVQDEVPIYPSRPGVVIDSHAFPASKLPNRVQSKGGTGYGQYVKVEHDVGGKKMYTVYAHMYRVYAKVGDVVNMNDILGIVGNTGASTGAHIHFEIQDSNRVPMDPRLFLYCGGDPMKTNTQVEKCFNMRGEL